MAKKKIGFGDLYCAFCGEGVEKKTDICPKCGHRYDDSKFDNIELFGAGGIGWSEQSDNPCFKQRNKKNVIGMIIIMMIVSLIIFSVIYFTSDLEISELLPIFGGVMAVEWIFWIIWLIAQYANRNGWEGTVERKESYQQEYTRKDAEGYRQTYTQTVYKVHFRKLNGKRKTLTSIDHCEWYDYLHEGDRVRYHGKNMNYYEKFDKSRDRFIPCASCGAMRDPRDNYCGRCGCVILKAPHPATPQQAFMNQRPVNGEAPYAIPITNPDQESVTEGVNRPVPKFCPNCGSKTNGGKFCRSCGTKLM